MRKNKRFLIFSVLLIALGVVFIVFSSKQDMQKSAGKTTQVKNAYIPPWQNDIKKNVEVLKTQEGVPFWYMYTPESPMFSMAFMSKYSAENGNYRFYSKGQDGLNDLLSELFLAGSKTKTAKEISDFLREKSAYVSIEPYGYGVDAYIRFLTRDAKEVFPVYKELLFSPRFDEKRLQIAKEKSNALLLQDTYNVSAAVNYQAYLNVLGKYGLQSFGPKKYSHINRKDIQNFYKELLAKDSIRISVATSMSKEDIIGYMSYLFDPMKKQFDKPEVDTYTVKIPKIRQNIVFSKPQTYIYWAGDAFETNKKTRAIFKVLQNILTVGMDSYLFKKIRKEQGLVYWIDVSLKYYDKYVAGITGSTEVANEKAQKLLKALQNAIKDVKYGNIINADSVFEAKKSIINRYLYSLVSNDSIVHTMLSSQDDNLHPNYIQEKISAINAVSVQDVKDMARKMLQIKMLITAGKPNIQSIQNIENAYKKVLEQTHK